MDKNLLDAYIKDKLNKNKTIENSPGLLREIRESIFNFYRKVITFNSLEIASIAKTLYKWNDVNKTNYKSNFAIRDIVLVDLGLGYGFELSYEHPCVILNINNDGFFLAIPCSTGKYYKNSRFILKGEIKDGFNSKTGVLLDSIRTISQTRISHKVGEITPMFLDYINSKILTTYLPKEAMLKRNLENDLSKAEQTILDLQKQINELGSLNSEKEGIDLIQ